MNPGRILGVALAVAGCATGTPAPSRIAPAPGATAAPGRQATPPADAGAAGIRWYRDDPDAAFAQAWSEKKLVVVDLWAAWCHTCLSMKEFVLTDKKLPGAGARFVFLSIDTELARNADFLQEFPTSGWPTFYVLAPDGPKVRARWLGAASPGKFARFLADAEHAEALARGGGPGREPLLSLARGDELASQGRYAEAADQYASALAQAPHDWPRAADVRVARASALSRAGNAGACVDLALADESRALDAPISASDQSSYTLDCAERLPGADPRRQRAQARVEATLALLCEQGAPEMTPDDRGDACGNLISAREALGDAPGAKRAAEMRLLVLEDAARGMPDDVAAIYDPARSDTLLTLGRGEEALALLEAREHALPDSYNPPHHLARVALKLRRWELGLAAIERALGLARGPRRANLYAVKADLLLGVGKKSEAVAALEAELAVLTALPPGQKRPQAERSAREKLAKLGP